MIEANLRLPVRVPAETWAAWRAQLSEYQNRKVDHLERQGHVVVWRVRNVPEPFVEVEGSGVPSITSLDLPEPPPRFTEPNPSMSEWARALLYTSRLSPEQLRTYSVREWWL